MKITDQNSKRLFSQAYILGGSPCSGKSTIAERLSSEFNLQYYKVDDHEREHSNRCEPDRHPVMCKYAKMDWSEIWMRPVTYQVEELLIYYRERFEMIAQDLETYDREEPIVLEGAAYLPELLELNDANPDRVIFFVPTKEFQLCHYSQRPWINHILKECTDPKQAFENWMMRDHLYGQEILLQAQEKNYKTILVNGDENIDQQHEKVKVYFGLNEGGYTPLPFILVTRSFTVQCYDAKGKNIRQRSQYLLEFVIKLCGELPKTNNLGFRFLRGQHPLHRRCQFGRLPLYFFDLCQSKFGLRTRIMRHKDLEQMHCESGCLSSFAQLCSRHTKG